MEEDYDVGHSIRTSLIPEAVLWYTGEAIEEEDDEDDEGLYDDVSTACGSRQQQYQQQMMCYYCSYVLTQPMGSNFTQHCMMCC